MQSLVAITEISKTQLLRCRKLYLDIREHRGALVGNFTRDS